MRWSYIHGAMRCQSLRGLIPELNTIPTLPLAMSSVVRSRVTRVSLSNLTPAIGSLHNVRVIQEYDRIVVDILISKNASGGVKARATAARPDAVTKARRLAPVTGNRRLGLKVVRRQFLKSSPRGALSTRMCCLTPTASSSHLVLNCPGITKTTPQ